MIQEFVFVLCFLLVRKGKTRYNVSVYAGVRFYNTDPASEEENEGN